MLKTIYDSLYSHFGSQHWWPVTKQGHLKPEYHKKIKLNEKQKLEICFGAILTQNTSWKNAEKAIIKLNKSNLIDINEVIKAKNNGLAKIIKSSGYHNQKAKKLKNFCQFLKNNYDSDLKELFSKDANELRNELLSINGIGPETADSITLYAAKKQVFVIDAYTKRIYSRIFNSKDKKYEDLQRIFMENLEKDEKLFNEYHALLVELGKNICKKTPLCPKCPLNSMCSYAATPYTLHQ